MTSVANLHAVRKSSPAGRMGLRFRWPKPAAEPEIIVRARYGNAGALGELFDAVLPDVYRHAMRGLHDETRAECLTEAVLLTLPHTLRRRRWTSLEQLKRYLFTQMSPSLGGERQRRHADRARKDGWIRHLVLAGLGAHAVFLVALQVV